MLTLDEFAKVDIQREIYLPDLGRGRWTLWFKESR